LPLALGKAPISGSAPKVLLAHQVAVEEGRRRRGAGREEVGYIPRD